MFYIIIPITAGDDPQSWYAYLLRVGPITIYQSKQEITDQQLLLRFYCNERSVHHFDNPQIFNKKEMTLNFSFIPLNQLRFELCENLENLSLQRLDTNYFYHNAWRLRFNYQDRSVVIGKKSYFLLCSGLFKSPPVSISRKPENREILYYNEDSETLNDCYQGLCKTGLRKGVDALLPNLECLSHFVRNVFESNDIKKIPGILGDKRNKMIEFEGPTPVSVTAVNLKRFINESVGICRHNAMLVCYLLKRMQTEGWLPEGGITHYRMTLPNRVGHSFVLFQTMDHHELYVIDSTLNHVYYLPTMREKFTRCYSHDIYSNIRDKYLLEEICEATLPLNILSQSSSKL